MPPPRLSSEQTGPIPTQQVPEQVVPQSTGAHHAAHQAAQHSGHQTELNPN
jgi:hypothetical protein